MRIVALNGFAVFLTLVFCTPTSRAQCSSHFINNTDAQWSVVGQNGDAQPLIVAPHSTAEIDWGAAATQIVLQSTINGQPYTVAFRTHRSAGCYVILPTEGARRLQINKPHMGDVTACFGRC